MDADASWHRIHPAEGARLPTLSIFLKLGRAGARCSSPVFSAPPPQPRLDARHLALFPLL
jgi:hypothetical protein